MNKLVQFFVIGAVLIAAIKLFHWEEKIGQNVIDRAKAGVQGRDPEQAVIAIALTMMLGVVAVIAMQAFRKAA